MEINAVTLAVFAAGSRLGVQTATGSRYRLGQCVVALGKHLNVSRQLIYTWIKDGHLNRTSLEVARSFAEAAGMPVEAFGQPITPAPRLRRHA